MSQKYPESLPLAQVSAGIRSMGIDPTEVHHMVFRPDKIVLTVFDLDESGHRHAASEEEFATREVTVELT